MSPTRKEPTVSHEDQDGVRIVHIHEPKLGELIDTQLLKVALLEAAAGATLVAVDFGDVAYMNSEMIGKILSFNREVTERGCKTIYFNMRPFTRDTFQALNLQRVLDICETRQEAIAKLKGHG